jgi:hypothetical protein
MLRMPTSSLKSATTMLEKLLHSHYFYQTNPKTQSKSETEPRTQPEKTPAHTKLLLLQPKENQKNCINAIIRFEV